MSFVIAVLTVAMVATCLLLILLVLIQLPKKEAGAGLAFGGGASDALFGAGSGNVLTKVTKYAAGIFFALAVFLSVLQRNYHNETTSDFQRALENPGLAPRTSAPAPAPSTPPPSTPITSIGNTNGLM